MTPLTLCGLKVVSDLPLPDLLPWTGDGRAPDLCIRRGAVPALDCPDGAGPLQIAEDGTCRFSVEAVATYRIDPAGREIVVEPYMPCEAPDIRAFLFGTVFAVVCFRRGLLPLHASVVRIGDKAVAFSGVSGAGKSTMAALFLKRGCPILADDVAVTKVEDGKVLVLPAFPRLKLWRDAMDGLSFATDGLEQTYLQREKFHMPVDAFAAEPQTLTSLYHLEEASDPAEEDMRDLSGVAAFAMTKAAVYRTQLGLRLIGNGALFTLAGEVAGAVRSVLLRRVKTLHRAEEIVEQVIRRETAA